MAQNDVLKHIIRTNKDQILRRDDETDDEYKARIIGIAKKEGWIE